MTVFLQTFTILLISTIAVFGLAQHSRDGIEEQPQKKLRHQVLVLGDSIAAFPNKNFGNILQATCKNTLWRNISKSNLTAKQLLDRFDRYLGKNNRRAKWRFLPHPKWLIVFGGINSVEDPDQTIESLRDIYIKAYTHDFTPIGLSLTPWGSLKDKRWQGSNSVITMAYTKRIVDFIMGRLSPRQALKENKLGWEGLEQAAIKVDLFNSKLRAQDAKYWKLNGFESSLLKHRILGEFLRKLPEEKRKTRIAKLAKAYQSFPTWFLDKEYQSFDHVHINKNGHLVIAETICEQAPEAWQCDCDQISTAIPVKTINDHQ